MNKEKLKVQIIQVTEGGYVIVEVWSDLGGAWPEKARFEPLLFAGSWYDCIRYMEKYFGEAVI
jgi:hypothetical protein